MTFLYFVLLLPSHSSQGLTGSYSLTPNLHHIYSPLNSFLTMGSLATDDNAIPLFHPTNEISGSLPLPDALQRRRPPKSSTTLPRFMSDSAMRGSRQRRRYCTRLNMLSRWMKKPEDLGDDDKIVEGLRVDSKVCIVGAGVSGG